MSRILIDDIVKNHDQWIAQKKTHIGSGDIATIAGANEFQTPLKLWAIKKGREAPDAENDVMWWGQVMEKPIAELCGRSLGIPVNYGNKLYGAESPEWATATPDYFGRVDDENVIVECKNVGYRSKYKWEDDAPLAPRIQVMWQLGVTGFKRGIIAPLIGGDILDFTARWVEFDSKIFDQLLYMADRFWWHVQNDVPPAPTAEDTKLVDKLIGSMQDSEVSIDSNWQEMIKKYEEIKELESQANKQVKELKETSDEIKNKLRFLIGPHKSALCGDYRIKCTRVEMKERLNPAYEYTRFTVSKNRSKDD